MQYVILGLLLDGPLSLYDVHKRFSAGIALFYRASFGSIQRALRGLADDRLVSVVDDPDSPRGRRLYSITAAGSDAWRDWMTAPLEAHDPETTMLARVFLLGRLPAAERPETLRRVRERLEHDLAGLRALAGAMDATPPPEGKEEEFGFQRATLDYGLRSHELALAWLGDLDAGPDR